MKLSVKELKDLRVCVFQEMRFLQQCVQPTQVVEDRMSELHKKICDEIERRK